jgi:hypothetical protein
VHPVRIAAYVAIAVLTVLVFATIAVCSPGTHTVAVGSPDSTPPPVQVLVRETSTDPLTYEYLVINNSKLPIRYLAIGRAAKDEDSMMSISENIPVRVSGPPGWTGDKYFGYESKYMNIAWLVNKGVTGIQTGERLGGFVVTMPPRSGKKMYDGEGGEVKPMDMMKAPCVVRFQGSSEMYGIVQANEKIEKRP